MENKEKTTTPEMPDIDVLFELADLFKVFGDSTRLRIMYTISENEMSVLNIAEALSMEQSTISHQLRVLRQNKLVRVRREGKQIYYSLDDDLVTLLQHYKILGTCKSLGIDGSYTRWEF